ncbi:hypothetical protein [Streptomyces sp. NBC_01455]|nr:hypothetical protein [Streptomyces sp. NBC_01455]
MAHSVTLRVGNNGGVHTMRWKAALQAFDITFDGRLTAGRR